MTNDDEIYILYENIIDDFCKNIIIKNNIRSLDDIFFLYRDAYLNSIFSKNTKSGFQRKETDYKKDIYDDNGELLSDYMGYDNSEYFGIYMVNGNGVCRHVNSMFKDILNRLNEIDNYRYPYIVYTDIDMQLNKKLKIDTDDDVNKKIKEMHKINKNIHTACYVKGIDDMFYLDPYFSVFNYIKPDYADITNFKDNNIYTKLENELKVFRLKHIKEYELISYILHKKYDNHAYTKITRILFNPIEINKNRSR